MKPAIKHQLKTAFLQKEVGAALKENKKIFIKRDGARHTTHSKSCLHGYGVDVSSLNKILNIDSNKQEVWVEPEVTMKALVKATYKQGLIPKVIPEFKGITVGGAIQGGALESSSFRHGQFNDTCQSFELLLGDGRILWASAEAYSDLFHGVSSSYGSLALLLSVKVKLEPHTKRVHLDLYRFSQISRMTRAIKSLMPLSHYNFIEGIGFHSNQWVLIVGKHTDEKGRHHLNLNKRSPWYYEQIHKLAKQKIDEVEMDLKSYLFRHDQGAFWMASHLNSWKTFLLSLFQKKTQKKRFMRLIGELKKQPFQLSRPILRWTLGSRLSSQSLYKILNRLPTDWVREHLMIQDCYLPLKNIDQFLFWVEEKIKLFPLWLCPIKAGDQGQLFAPHSSQESSFFVNIGLYGIPKEQGNAQELTTLLEKKVTELGGRKMLYGHNFYNKGSFWNHYPLTSYENLRKKYGGENIFFPITKKVLAEA